MLEFYKEVARYRADIQHDRTGEMIDFNAVVYEGPDQGRFYIQYSHVLKPTDGAGFYYSNSYTAAEDPESAEQLVRGWAKMLKESHEFKPWSK